MGWTSTNLTTQHHGRTRRRASGTMSEPPGSRWRANLAGASCAEPQELRLVDRCEDHNHRRLDDLLLAIKWQAIGVFHDGDEGAHAGRRDALRDRLRRQRRHDDGARMRNDGSVRRSPCRGS